MHYLGGKARISKYIVPILKKYRKEKQIYLEPFLGSGWIFQYLECPKIGSDIQPDLIALWLALQNDWIPPENISAQQYKKLKISPVSALRGFVGFGCSFSGKFFGGYARSGNRNYTKNAKDSLLKKLKYIKSAELYCKNYWEHKPINYLIYCDPPYENTTTYGIKFDHDRFWWTMNKWKINNSVFVSEYKAPNSWKTILEIETKTDLRTKQGKEKRTEKLFLG